MYGEANTDEREFCEPQRFDVTRRRGSHVAFGLVTHFCLGAKFAPGYFIRTDHRERGVVPVRG